MKKNMLLSVLPALTFLGLLSCSGGGGNDPAPSLPILRFATNLTYTDPGGTGFRLVKAPSSASGKLLVLELRGPAGTSTGRGVSFGLTVDGSKAWFVQVDGSDPEYAQNVAFDLGSSPQLFKAVREGNNVLRASIAQKGQSNAKALDGVLARVALLLQSNVLPGTIAFTASGDSKALLGGNGAPEPITIAVGALGAQ